MDGIIWRISMVPKTHQKPSLLRIEGEFNGSMKFCQFKTEVYDDILVERGQRAIINYFEEKAHRVA
jgi:hypothetical protein